MRRWKPLVATLAALAAGPVAAQAPYTGRHVEVDLSERMVYVTEGRDTLFSALVATGKPGWETPLGSREVLRKAIDPIWTPPDWHYEEVAARLARAMGRDEPLPVHHLSPGETYELSDGYRLVATADNVYREDLRGVRRELPQGRDIVYDATVFAPPLTSKQRRNPFALGPRALYIGDGYMLHGTRNESSVGNPVSHGCLRLRNEDILHLYDLIPEGTPVEIAP